MKSIALVITFFFSAIVFQNIAFGQVKKVKGNKNPGLVVYFIDIGQGDAALIKSYNNKTVLVDTGPPKSRKKLVKFLKSLKIKKINALILTHAHADHIGGAASVIKNFEVGIIYDPAYPHTSSIYLNLLKLIKKKKIRYKKAVTGQKIIVAPDIIIKILHPQRKFIEDSRSVLNSNSIVFKLTFNKISFLFTGDEEADTEMLLVKKYGKDLKSTILKVPHHGSKYSSVSKFLDLVKPEVGVISCGKNNRYHHPHKRALKRLLDRGVKVYVTMLNGTVIVKTNGKRYKVIPTRMKKPGGRVIFEKMSRKKFRKSNFKKTGFKEKQGQGNWR